MCPAFVRRRRLRHLKCPGVDTNPVAALGNSGAFRSPVEQAEIVSPHGLLNDVALSRTPYCIDRILVVALFDHQRL